MKKPHAQILGCTVALAAALALGSTAAFASSHMDAPLITRDQPANTTDVYAFVVVRNNQKFLDVALAVYPHEEPGVGPNKYSFDPNVLYQLFLADPVTGADRVAYQFQFADSYKSSSTILQSYTGVVAANGDNAQNFTQTYTVTKVAGCCGLAGNFGVEQGHYEVSVAVAETHLLPAVRSQPHAVVLADGMSCRVQLDDLAHVPTMHLAELFASKIEG